MGSIFKTISSESNYNKEENNDSIGFNLLNKKNSNNKLSRKLKDIYDINIPKYPIQLESLNKEWKNIAGKEKDLQASAYLLLLDQQKSAELNSNIPLPAASSIKISILVAILEMIEDGLIDWNEFLELTSDVIAGGAGWMAYQPIGKKFPIHEIATEMIRE